MIDTLNERREEFTAVAARHRREVIAGKRSQRSWRVAEIKPILTPAQFEALVKVLNKNADDDEVEARDEVDVADKDSETNALLILRDYCADTKEIPVFYEDEFIDAKSKSPAKIGPFQIVRPVNGVNPLRYRPSNYAALELLLTNFAGAPRQWVSTNERKAKANQILLARCMAADMYQDAMRIQLRHDPASTCTIFAPIEAYPLLVTRMARLFQAATFIIGSHALPTTQVKGPHGAPERARERSSVACGRCAK